ncbi:MAG: DOPA 4,5-dioxygenase family protein [Alphaproteobacteria bacterium]
MPKNIFNIKATPEPEFKPDAYHIHIYFKPGEASEKNAIEVARTIDSRFPGAVEDMHRVGKVGPHTEANIGMTITPESFGAVLGWLQMNNKGLSILIHPRTGDELVDHGDAALWLGKPVPFNEKFFDQFRPQAPKGPSLQ